MSLPVLPPRAGAMFRRLPKEARAAPELAKTVDAYEDAAGLLTQKMQRDALRFAEADKDGSNALTIDEFVAAQSARVRASAGAKYWHADYTQDVHVAPCHQAARTKARRLAVACNDAWESESESERQRVRASKP